MLSKVFASGNAKKLLLPLVVLQTACGGGGGSSDNNSSQNKPALTAAEISLSLQQVKQFNFGWADVEGATHYRLLENSDGESSYVQVGESIAPQTESVSLTVPLCHRLNAKYKLQSCNASECLDSQVVDVVGNLAESIGFFKASNTGADDRFGFSVSISGDGSTLAVGAPREDSSSTGVNGDQTDNQAASAGAVYIYVLQDGQWLQQAYIKASNAGASDQFGFSTSLSYDGDILVVGAVGEASDADGINTDQNDNSAAGAGAVYVFGRTDEVWSEHAYIKADNSDSGDYFGWSVSTSNAGDVIAVSAPNESSQSQGVNGNGGDNSAASSGAVYLFERVGSDWVQQAYLKTSNANAGDSLGYSVSLSGNGLWLAAGAHGEAGGATGVNGNQSDNSMENAGAVYLWQLVARNWVQHSYIKASNTNAEDRFGWSVSLNDSADVLAAGAYGEESSATGIDGDQNDNTLADAGAVYVFSRDNDTWLQQAYIKSSNAGAVDLFGHSTYLSADGNSLAVGAYSEQSMSVGLASDQDSNSGGDTGAVYIYNRVDNGWDQSLYIKASNSGHSDLFGWSLSASDNGETLAVGAPLEQSGASGIGSDQLDDSADNAGAVYLY